MTSAPATAEKSAANITDPAVAPVTQTPVVNLPAQVASRQEKNPIASGGRVAAIVPQTYEDVWRLAGAIAASKMAPKAYKVDPRAEASPFSQEKITVGIMHGMEVGFTPMASLQSIAVINGMPSIWGDGMLALVKSSGLLEEIREWIEGDGTGLVAHCWVLRRGNRNPTEQTFSMAEAAKAGLMSKDGPWKTYTRRMLQMRARSWALRDEFPDVLRGLVSAEEAIDMGVLTDDGSGTYASDRPAPPPAPTRAAIAATVEAEKVIEQDLNRNSDRLPDSPQETGDEPEEGDESSAGSDQAAPEPVQIPVPTGADNKPDWSAWADTVKGTVAQAPDADWLRAWNVMHSSALNNLKKAAAALHGDVTGAIENRRKELAGG